MPSPLLLIPTAQERDLLLKLPAAQKLTRAPLVLGFGLVGAAVGLSRVLAARQEGPFVLLGLAGSFDLSAAPLGSAHRVGVLQAEGIGVGRGAAHVDAAVLGFPHLPEMAPGSRLSLGVAGPLALSVAAGSRDEEEARDRRRRHPRALLEEMEGFGAALCAQAFGQPLAMIRGVSNEVGHRDLGSWHIAGALEAALDLALQEFGA